MIRTRVFSTLFFLIASPASGQLASSRAVTPQATVSFFPTRTDSPTGASPRAIVALDYNADGRTDLAVANVNDGTISLLKGNGTAAFTSGEVLQVSGATAMGAHDYNEDGQLDLVASTNGFDVGVGYAILYDLSQAFPQATVGNVGSADTGQELAAADFNGDGHQDFAVVSPFGGNVTVVLCNGNGTCRPAASYTAGNTPFGVTSGDFNGDGKPDLVVSLGGENKVAVLLNTGNGTFAPPVKYPTGNAPTWVVTGDFNGDGKIDIAVVNSHDATVSILIGVGDGTFKPKVDYSAGTFAMAAADFNGDGKLDLAVTNSAAGTVSILIGNGDGSFQAPLTLATGNVPQHIVAADFDGDGTIDLAVTNSKDNTVSVWLNTRLATPPAPFPTAVTPVVSSGATQVLTVNYAAFGGYATLDVLNVLINTYLDGRQACYLAYSRSANTLNIVGDNGDASKLTGAVMNGTGTVGNSQCTVNLAGSSATGSGNTLTLVLNMTFASGFAGNKVIYAAARDLAARNSGWQVMGAYGVPGGTATFPIPTVSSPFGGVTSSQTFTFTYQDQSNATNLQTVWALTNTAIDGRASCYVAYYRPGNQVYLYPDNGDGSQATNMVLTGNNSLSNSQCTVSAQGSNVVVNGNTLTVSLPIAFKPGFAGHRGTWLAAQTLGGAATSAWQALGDWTVPAQLVQ